MDRGTMRTVIEGKDLAIGYGNGNRGRIVHSGLNFMLRQGELTCLLGENGAGKSTLLRTLAAVQPPLEGELLLMGRPAMTYSERERSRMVGIVLTDRTQAGGLTVRELVALGRQPYTGFFGRLTRSDRERVDYAIEAVGIEAKAANYVAELSDGERQKVMIAKALVQECPLILLDEPTAFLDVVSRIEIMTLLRRLAVEEKRAILLSTHDIEQALVLGDCLWLLNAMNGLECGTTEDIVLRNRMDDLFAADEISFDLMHGVYSPTVQGHRCIYLSASDEVLLHWAQNALNRNGFLCPCPPRENQDESVPVLKVYSASRLLFSRQGDEMICTSFEELLSVLKSEYSRM